MKKSHMNWRKLLQIRLSTVMLTMTAICIALGYVVTRPKKRFHSPFESLQRAGAVLELTYSLDTGPAWRLHHPEMKRDAEGDYYDYTNYRLTKVDFSGKEFDRSVLAQLKFCPDVVDLDLSKSKVTNDDLTHIAMCKRLRTLRLNDSAIRDADLSVLNKLHALKNLDLDATEVGDRAVSSLAIPSLQSFAIRGTKVTDAGLTHISKMTGLQSIFLDNTKIGGGGLQKLSSHPSLQKISLAGTGVNADDLAELLPCQNLNNINLANTRATDGVFQVLEKFQKLQFVHVPSGYTTEAAANVYRKSHPNVVVLWDRYENGLTGKEGKK